MAWWHHTREVSHGTTSRSLAKRTLVRTIADEPDPVEQGRRILELGVYAAPEDVPLLAKWVAPHQPGPMQAAAGLVWAWVVNPEPLPAPAAAALRANSHPDSDAFARLPRTGVYSGGPWMLPANAAELILRLADSEHKELRWRAVQGFEEGRGQTAKHLSAAQVLPVLFKRLSDDYNRIRSAAALVLSQRGELVLQVEPGAVALLMRALDGHQSRGWGDAVPSLDSDMLLWPGMPRGFWLPSLTTCHPPSGRRRWPASIVRRAATRTARRNTLHSTTPASRRPAS